MRAIRMLLGVTLVTVGACADRPPTPEKVVGVYRADLAGTATPGRAVTLELNAGNAAQMAVDHHDGASAVVESGTWSLNPRGEIRVVLARNGFGPVTSDVTFRWADGALTAIAFDTLRWGGRGFALVRE